MVNLHSRVDRDAARFMGVIQALVVTVLLAVCGSLVAQPPGGAAPSGSALPAQQLAPIDITGYWVSVVNEDWRWRMMTPPKGDYTSIPLNPSGWSAADQWDPEADIAAGDECKAYGALGITRLPGRMHISWADESTLQVEFDNGMQTRLLHFAQPPTELDQSLFESIQQALDPREIRRMALGARPQYSDAPTPSGPPSRQGHSVAEWQKQIQSIGFRSVIGVGAQDSASGGALMVTTTNLLPGYLRKNGVPYSADVVLTEYFDRFDLPNGDPWLLLSSVVEDPTYLMVRFLVSSHFKKEPDGSNWSPKPCSAR